MLIGMASKSKELAIECQRQFDGCLYTALTMILWVKVLSTTRTFLVVLSLACGAFASWPLVDKSVNDHVRLAGAAAALLAGLIPTVLAALKLERNIRQCRQVASEFTNLRDAFRQAALVHSQKPYPEFEAVFQRLMGRMDKARKVCVTPPELMFTLARWKIRNKDYSFDVDAAAAADQDGAKA